MHCKKVLPNAALPFKASSFTLLPGETSDRDAHQVPELWILLEGTGILASGNAEIPLCRTSVVFFPPWVPHQITAKGGEPLTVLNLWWPEVIE
jgi:mannose-6-phosphate isomerase-like protein (cupin superfamily)